MMPAIALPPVAARGTSSLPLTTALPLPRPGMLRSSPLKGAHDSENGPLVDGADEPSKVLGAHSVPLAPLAPGPPAIAATIPTVQVSDAWGHTAVSLPESSASVNPRCVLAVLESVLSRGCQTGVKRTLGVEWPPTLAHPPLLSPPLLCVTTVIVSQYLVIVIPRQCSDAAQQNCNEAGALSAGTGTFTPLRFWDVAALAYSRASWNVQALPALNPTSMIASFE